MLKPALMLSFSLVALAACQPLATTPVPVPSAVVSSTPQPVTTPDTPAVGPVASASPSAAATPAPLPTSNPAAAAQASVTLPDGSRLDISLPNRFFEDQGQTLQVSVKLFDAEGRELPLTGRKLVFSSSRPQDFSISEQGLITALTDIGFSEIQVRLEGTNLFASQLLSVSSASTFTSGGGPRPTPTPKPTPTPLEALNVTAGFEGLVTGDFQVNTYTPDTQDEATIAHDSNGNFVVVWESSDQDGDVEGIYGQRYNSAGVPQGPEFQVNTFASNTQDGPAVAMDSAGNFVVVWASDGQDGNENGVYAQRYNSAGVAQGSEFQVNTYTTDEQDTPAVAMDSAGNFVVVWESWDQDGDENGIYGQRYNSAGVPQGSEFQVSTYTTNGQDDPKVAMDSAGNFVVVWETDDLDDGSSDAIYGQRYNSAGVAQGSEFQVNTYTTSDQDDVSVAMDSAGNFVVVWESSGQDVSSTGVYAQRYNSAGAPQGSEFQVNTYTTSGQGDPSVAIDAAGNFVIGWESSNQDGGNTQVYAQRYDSAGVAQGAEFRINSSLLGSRGDLELSMDPAGNLVIVFDHSGEIFGRRFDVNGRVQ
jgi:hypothetical protein